MTIERCDLASEMTEPVSSSLNFFRSCRILRYMLILFLSADDDFESFEVAENIEPNDLAPIDRAENIERIERPDSDLNEASDIVSPAIDPSRFRRVIGVAIMSGSA